jgi:DNA adenine methylase
LNKTCFNGLYRVNKSGGFNVPMGSYKNPSIFDEKKLRKASEMLKGVKLISGDFEKIMKYIDKNSFVYLDPPYYTEKNGFTTYTEEDFGKEDQERLAKFCKQIDKKKAKFMLSNSDTKFIKSLYKDFKKKTVSAKRMINCKGKGRGPVKEVVFRNY